jgi:hypothetical protein
MRLAISRSRINSDCAPSAARQEAPSSAAGPSNTLFQRGSYHVVLRLKKRDKAITQATVIVEIRPGLRDL